jgi:hypothetical protein
MFYVIFELLLIPKSHLMKIVYTLLFASFSLLFLSHCREEGGTMKGYFWTRNQGEGPYSLYVNDTLKGVLPYREEPPKCGEPDLDKKTLFVLLTSGTHKIVIKDQQGHTHLSEEYTLEKKSGHFSLSVSMRQRNGINKHVMSGDCTVEELGF